LFKSRSHLLSLLSILIYILLSWVPVLLSSTRKSLSAIRLPDSIDFFNILIILISLLLCLGLKRRPRKTRTAAYLERNPALYPGPIPGIYPGVYAPVSSSGLKLTSCVAGTEKYLQSYTFPVPCRHRFCGDCLTTLFENATKEEFMYPPRCCGQVIPLAFVRSIIGPNLLAAVAHKATEFGSRDRTYCANSSCRSFIPPGRIVRNIAFCLKCAKLTCSICQGPGHLGGCPSDSNAKLLLELAEKKQWQFYGKCHGLVERKSGCDHMT
jgi:hypothetical protein